MRSLSDGWGRCYYYDTETRTIPTSNPEPESLKSRIAKTEEVLKKLKEELRAEIRTEQVKAKALKKLTAEEKKVLGLA